MITLRRAVCWHAGSKVRFILMNSFSTSADTTHFLKQNHAGKAG
jgi:hypothetical protein